LSLHFSKEGFLAILYQSMIYLKKEASQSKRL